MMVEVSLMALHQLPTGARARVRQIAGGGALACRLAALGLSVGAEVVMVQNYGHGPLIALARETRIALGRGEAAQVWVEAVAHG
jgi:ferrous iron transport protein A